MLKKMLVGGLIAAQVFVPPLAAAELGLRESNRVGAFAGVRMRLPLDGQSSDRQMRAELALAPAVHSRSGEGQGRTRFGDGLSFGIRRDQVPELRLAGTRIDRLGLAPNGSAPDGQRAGVSTLGWVAIGLGATAVVVIGVGYLWLDDALDCDPEDECN